MQPTTIQSIGNYANLQNDPNQVGNNLLKRKPNEYWNETLELSKRKKLDAVSTEQNPYIPLANELIAMLIKPEYVNFSVLNDVKFTKIISETITDQNMTEPLKDGMSTLVLFNSCLKSTSPPSYNFQIHFMTFKDQRKNLIPNEITRMCLNGLNTILNDLQIQEFYSKVNRLPNHEKRVMTFKVEKEGNEMMTHQFIHQAFGFSVFSFFKEIPDRRKNYIVPSFGIINCLISTIADAYHPNETPNRIALSCNETFEGMLNALLENVSPIRVNVDPEKALPNQLLNLPATAYDWFYFDFYRTIYQAFSSQRFIKCCSRVTLQLNSPSLFEDSAINMFVRDQIICLSSKCFLDRLKKTLSRKKSPQLDQTEEETIRNEIQAIQNLTQIIRIKFKNQFNLIKNTTSFQQLEYTLGEVREFFRMEAFKYKKGESDIKKNKSLVSSFKIMNIVEFDIESK